MKKILFLITCMSIGGAEKVLIDLVNNLDRNKYDVTVMMVYKNNIYNQGNCSFDSYFKEDIKVKYMCNNDNKVIYRLFNMVLHRVNNKLIHKFFIADNYDVEIAYYEGLPTKIIANSSNKKSKKISWLHTDAINRTKGYSDKNIIEEKKIYLNFDDIVAVSNSVADSFIRLHKEFKNVIVKYNPIDSYKIIKNSRENMDIDLSNNIKFISIGRIIPVKGYLRLAKIMKKLADDNLEFQWIIVGDGEQREVLDKKIREYNLQDKVKIIGFKSNPYKYLKNCDVLVCSSFAEGYNTVVLESIYLNKPIITTDCAGMSEIFGQKKCGLICENSEEGLYQSIKEIIKNPEDLKLYIKECKIRAKELTLESAIKEIEVLF